MDYSGMKVLIMGLGLHGGGLESGRYLLRHEAELTVTDLRDEQTLAPSIAQLEAAWKDGSRGTAIRYVLGRHEIDDFRAADMVIKNPGVPPNSPFLQAARRIETDISLFLAAIHGNLSHGPRLVAVTGSKGKSSTASALHWVLACRGGSGKAWLGGNITVSPLAFVDELATGDDVVLELSSWQLGDIKGRRNADGSPLLKPKAAVLTPIMPDHLDRYGSMEAYVNDKRVIYQGQDSGDITVAQDDSWGRSFLAESKARPLVYASVPLPEKVSGGWLDDPAGPGLARLCGWQGVAPGIADDKAVEIVPAQTLVPGRHQKQNLLAAGLALLGLGLPHGAIREGLGSFPGVEHRLELFHQARGVDFYNDSAATIPEAAAAAVDALGGDGRLVLVAGGTDKNLDFSPLVQAAGRTKAIILLAGSGSDKLRALLANTNVACLGPFDSVEKAAVAALETAKPGDRIALSPGCASFGMFLNEFDRGRKWKEAVRRLA
ncbi:MAG: UDP-N-acetylmuramoyl-L-alanine--D-glutamate ligase [Treponema sp.]|jgi:UDP-N-acetylmuramoylalanine--D-glutamate ligase|nr:UDP-N-acetylmuramoyl-L-alanine--D-glutamate ligase [Treponema sp.]